MLSKKIAILFSGSGSNLEAILQKVHGKIFDKNGKEITPQEQEQTQATTKEQAQERVQEQMQKAPNNSLNLNEHKNIGANNSKDNIASLAEQNSDLTKIECVCTITNNPDAGGIARARRFDIEPYVINHKNFNTREEFDAALVKKLNEFNPDLVVLAGFMRVLTPTFTNAIKAINLHPSILPLFKGAHAIKESFLSDMQVGGVSVHYVSVELDGGRIIAQRTFDRNGMNEEQWQKRIHAIEHELLPQTIINLLAKGE